MKLFQAKNFRDGCNDVLADEGPEAATIQAALPNGRVYDINIVRSPNTVEPGQGPGAIAVFHDISEIKRLENRAKGLCCQRFTRTQNSPYFN